MNVIWLLLLAGALAAIFKAGVVKDTGLSTAGIRGEFFEVLDATPARFQDLSTRIPSTTGSETYKFLGTVPQMREWGTGRLAKGLRTESYSVENLRYESTIEVDRDEIDDDQLGQIRIRVQEQAQRAALHKDYLIAQLLINGASSGYNSYDGVSFFNAAHVSGASGSQDNDLAPSATSPSVPTTAEFKTALATAIEALLAFLDDQGEPMNMSASGMIALVPPSMYFTALEAVSASMIATTSNVLQGAAQVISYPWLTTATTFYLLKTDSPVRSLIFQDRAPIDYQALDVGSEHAFKSNKLLFGVTARYRMTYGYWQRCVRSVFA